MVALAAALISLRAKTDASTDGMTKGRAFNLWHGILFAIGLTAITAVVAFANKQLGQLAVGISTAFAGFFDVHASSASAFSLAAGGKVDAKEVLLPMLLAFSTNTISKFVGAYAGGGPRYALRVGIGLVAVLAAMWLPVLLMR